MGLFSLQIAAADLQEARLKGNELDRESRGLPEGGGAMRTGATRRFNGDHTVQRARRTAKARARDGRHKSGQNQVRKHPQRDETTGTENKKKGQNRTETRKRAQK